MNGNEIWMQETYFIFFSLFPYTTSIAFGVFLSFPQLHQGTISIRYPVYTRGSLCLSLSSFIHFFPQFPFRANTYSVEDRWNKKDKSILQVV